MVLSTDCKWYYTACQAGMQGLFVFYLGAERYNLSVSHSLDSSPSRGALGKEVSFSLKLIGTCWKT